jgi:hypothetical protein
VWRTGFANMTHIEDTPMSINRSHQNWPVEETHELADQLKRADETRRENLGDEDELEFLRRTR